MSAGQTPAQLQGRLGDGSETFTACLSVLTTLLTPLFSVIVSLWSCVQGIGNHGSVVRAESPWSWISGPLQWARSPCWFRKKRNMTWKLLRCLKHLSPSLSSLLTRSPSAGGIVAGTDKTIRKWKGRWCEWREQAIGVLGFSNNAGGRRETVVLNKGVVRMDVMKGSYLSKTVSSRV